MVAVFGVVGTVAVGCGGENPYQAAERSSATSVATGTGTEENVFLPEEQNLGDCIGLVDKPDCGSKEKGGTGTYLTFAVLIAGLGVIFWRISKSIRQRDAVVNAPAAPAAPSRPPADGNDDGDRPTA